VLTVEERVERAVRLHAPRVSCAEHGLADHDCGSEKLLYRCWICVAPSGNKPCTTWRVLTGADE
jgi:hypothetical protein